MFLNGKIIDDLTEDDLLALVGTEEDRTIDFKGHGYHYTSKGDETWKRDLWIDVCSFANAVGGWIVCGMNDEEGRATELCGLGSIDPDAERRRLEQCISSGIEPKITGLQIRVKDLPTTGKGKAILIYVPRSFLAPHRVKDSRKFHIRRSNWNDEMNIEEIRAAFNLSESYSERIKNFRRERIEVFVEDMEEEIPIVLSGGVRFILHAVPLNFSNPGSVIDLSVFNTRFPARWVYEKAWSYGRYNLDGYVRPNGQEQLRRELDGYIQIYRNGTVECVQIIKPQRPKEHNFLTLHSLEDYALYYLDYAVHAQKNLGVQPPCILMLSLISAKDCYLIHESRLAFGLVEHPPVLLNSNRIMIPDSLIPDYDTEQSAMIRPILDMLWNTAGWERSLSYDEDGNWIRRDR